MPAPGLRIHLWDNDYYVPAGQPAPRAELDELAPRIAEALAARLAEILGEQDGVVLLPRLDIDLTVDTSCPTDRIVAHWSAQLAQAFARALADPAGGAVRFSSEAAYYAAFLGDMARERAWDLWYYRRFDGLRALPAAAVARTVLTEDARLGQEALSLIADAAWPALAALLTPREALRILAAWHGDGASQVGVDPSLRHDDLLSPGVAAPIRALRYLALWRRAPASAPGAPLGLACWLAALHSLPPSLPAAELARIARDADLRALLQTERAAGLATSSDADWLVLLAATPTEQRQVACKLAEAARQTVPDAATLAATSEFDAPYGGLAWLLPTLQSLLTPALLRALPAQSDCHPADLLALLTLALAGGPQADGVWRDPFWRTFFNLPPRFDQYALLDWLSAANPDAFREALAGALRQTARGGPVLLRFQHNGLSEERWVDDATASWLVGPTPTFSLPFGLRLAMTRQARRDQTLLSRNLLQTMLPSGWRDVLQILAQATLRHTAYRIPGQARSSLPYLFSQLLGVRGHARREGPTQWRLQLTRPPLHVLLSLTGLARLRLDWRGPTPRTLALDCAE